MWVEWFMGETWENWPIEGSTPILNLFLITSSDKFPKLSSENLLNNLNLPVGKNKIILDTDTANEIDDQFALAWALLSSDKIDLLGVTAEPYSFQHHKDELLEAYDIISNNKKIDKSNEELISSYHSWVNGLIDAKTHPNKIYFDTPEEGVEKSYQEIITIFNKLNLPHDGKVFRGYGGDEIVAHFLTNLSGGVVTSIIITMVAIFLLGFFLEVFEIIYVVVPIIGPAILMMGVDPLWFAIMIAINLQTSFLTPPFGFALFYLRGVAPKHVLTTQIYKGAMPFVFIQLLMLIILWLYPELATYLPKVIYS